MLPLQISNIPKLTLVVLTLATVLYLLARNSRQGILFAKITGFHHDTESATLKRGLEYDTKIEQWVRDTYYGDNCWKRNLSKCISSLSLPTCTLDVLRRHIIEHDELPSSGYWATGGKPTFCPLFCQIRDDVIQTKACQISESPIKVVVFGESTAGYLTQGLISALEKWGFGCSTSRQEHISRLHNGQWTRDVEYFKVPSIKATYLGGLPSMYRSPKLDKCYTKRCRFAVNNETASGQNSDHQAFDVEYISYSNVLETTLHLNHVPSQQSEQFSTFLEYVVRYYMPHQGYPHLLVFYAPFHHQIWHSSFSKAAAEIQYVQSIMEAFLPPTTKILWLPAELECLNLAPEDRKYPRGNDLDANQLLHGLNHVLYTILSSSLKSPTGNTYSFFNFEKNSCPHECIFHSSPAHLLPEVYELIGRKILQLACA